LQGILPPRPTSDRTDRHQQRVPTGYLGNPAGIQLAEADARIIAGQLIRSEFKWTDHVTLFTAETVTAAELLEKFKESYLKHASITSWHSYYSIAYKWLPQNIPITAKEIIKVLERHSKATASRQKAFNAMSVLVKFAKIEMNLQPYKSTYTNAKLNPKTIQVM
jgi:hypothetical protein